MYWKFEYIIKTCSLFLMISQFDNNELMIIPDQPHQCKPRLVNLLTVQIIVTWAPHTDPKHRRANIQLKKKNPSTTIKKLPRTCRTNISIFSKSFGYTNHPMCRMNSAVKIIGLVKNENFKIYSKAGGKNKITNSRIGIFTQMTQTYGQR